MNLQFLVDGVLTGAMTGLGAIGVSLTYSILRFSNFAHGEFISWGAYIALAAASALGWFASGSIAPLGPFSFGWGLIPALIVAMLATGFLAVALDNVLFRRLREKANAITAVMASFGASMALRSLLEFLFTSRPAYFSRELQIATPIGCHRRYDIPAIIVSHRIGPARSSRLMRARILAIWAREYGRLMAPPLAGPPGRRSGRRGSREPRERELPSLRLWLPCDRAPQPSAALVPRAADAHAVALAARARRLETSLVRGT